MVYLLSYPGRNFCCYGVAECCVHIQGCDVQQPVKNNDRITSFYSSITMIVSNTVPASTMQWVEPLGLLQRETKVSSVEDIPFLSLKEKPMAKTRSRILLLVTYNTTLTVTPKSFYLCYSCYECYQV